MRIGKKTNVQDGSVVHVDSRQFPTIIGDEVTIGHKALIHGCTVGSCTLIGMGSILMDGVQVGDECLVAAGSILTPGKIYSSGKLIRGIPAREVRDLTQQEKNEIRYSADHYVELAAKYLKNSLG